jgi:hypothetical protein
LGHGLRGLSDHGDERAVGRGAVGRGAVGGRPQAGIELIPKVLDRNRVVLHDDHPRGLGLGQPLVAVLVVLSGPDPAVVDRDYLGGDQLGQPLGALVSAVVGDNADRNEGEGGQRRTSR